MSIVRAFRALRPLPEKAAEVASPPYDVLNQKEARDIVAQFPHSFLRVVRAEVDFPEDVNPYSDEVYKKGGETLRKYHEDGWMIQDEEKRLYLYQQKMGDHVQIGVVGVASCLEYDEGLVRKHEFTRPDKENDRAKHIELLKAQTGPVWLTYHASEKIDALVDEWKKRQPTGHFVADDGIEHTFWVVDDADVVAQLEELFEKEVSLLYVADGHHRSAAASRVAKKYREQYGDQLPKDHPSQFFLSVIYPHNQLQILPYNRFVHDLNGLSEEKFLETITDKFDVQKIGKLDELPPLALHQFDMYLGGTWYRLTAREGTFNASHPVESLDVSILQENLLNPVLGIENPRTSKRIEFIGGIRGHEELQKLVDERGEGVSFACYPTSIEQLLSVADDNQVMPPKSTWFEPKLRSGLFVHLLDD